MNLPELYAKVCAKRPGATVAQDAMKLIYLPFSKSWEWAGKGIIISLAFNERTASALILQHWLGLLPRGKCLVHMSEEDPEMEWAVHDDITDAYQFGTRPVEALAAYLLDQAG